MSECYLDLEVVYSLLFGSSAVSTFRSAFAEWTVQVALQLFLYSILQISLILSVLANSRYHEPEPWAFFKRVKH